MVRIAIFVEDRLIRDGSGAVRTQNRRLQGKQWQDLGTSEGSMTLCARVKRASTQNEACHEVLGPVIDLPYYQGFRKALFRLPVLVLHTSRIVLASDLVIVKFPGLIGMIGAIVAKLARKPLAIHLVGDIEDSLTELNDSRLSVPRKIIARSVSKWIVKLADAVRYPTRSFLQKKYPPADTARSYWYTDASVNTLEGIPASRSFTKGRILAIGTQERMYKGHDLLIKALAEIRKSHIHAHLVLVGNGQYRPQLEDLVHQLGLSQSVEFIDFLDGWEEVSGMIKSANVFAMPSRTEGLPRALLEAMSLGTACIGSDVAGIPELLPSYLLVPKETVAPMVAIINQILEDETFRKVAAQDCLEGSRLFNATSMQPNIAAWKSRLDQLGRS